MPTLFDQIAADPASMPMWLCLTLLGFPVVASLTCALSQARAKRAVWFPVLMNTVGALSLIMAASPFVGPAVRGWPLWQSFGVMGLVSLAVYLPFPVTARRIEQWAAEQESAGNGGV